MSDRRDVFRCDYCGTLNEISQAATYWEEVDQLDDGRRIWLPATYCSPYCGRTATSRSGTGRG